MLFKIAHMAIVATLGVQMIFALSEKRYKLILLLLLGAFILDILLGLTLQEPIPGVREQIFRTSVSMLVVIVVAPAFYWVLCKVFGLEGKSLYPDKKRD